VTYAAVAALALATSLLQLGAVPSLFLHAERAPMLPIALLAAWIAVRGPAEAWAVLLIVPATLGAASEERVGWFILALLPTALAAIALRPGAHPSRRSFVVRASVAAGAGTMAYALTLAVAAARVDVTSDGLASLTASGVVTATVAGTAAILLLPLRPRAQGLFS
jgi:hypothetical protein